MDNDIINLDPIIRRYTGYFVPCDLSQELSLVDTQEIVFDNLDREFIIEESCSENENGDTTAVICFAFYNKSSEHRNARASFYKFDIRGDAYFVWLECIIDPDGNLIDDVNIFRSFIPNDYKDIASRVLRDKIGLYYRFQKGDDIYTFSDEEYKNPFPSEYEEKEWKGLSPKHLLNLFLSSSVEGIKTEYVSKYSHTIYSDNKKVVFDMMLRLTMPSSEEGKIDVYEFSHPGGPYIKKMVSEQNAALEFLKSLHANQIGNIEDAEEVVKTYVPFPPMDSLIVDFNFEKYQEIESQRKQDVIDIFQNGKLKKIVLKKGTGRYVPFNSKCKVHFVMAEADNERDEKDEADVLAPISKEELIDVKRHAIPAFKYMLSSMRKGEVSVYYANYELVYGDIATGTFKKQSFVFAVHVPDHNETILLPNSHQVEIAKSMQDKIDASIRHRKAGNVFFERKLYKLAFDEYYIGLIKMTVRDQFTKDRVKIPTVIPQEYIDAKCLLQMNIAAACLNMDAWIESKDTKDFGRYHFGLKNINEVLTQQPENIKALSRRARLLAHELDIDSSMADLTLIQEIRPNLDVSLILQDIKMAKEKLRMKMKTHAKKLMQTLTY